MKSWSNKLSILFLLLFIFILGVNIDRLISLTSQSKHYKYQYLQLEVSTKQKPIISSSSSTNPTPTPQTSINNQISLNSSGHICLTTPVNPSPHCTSTSFTNSKLIKTNQTQNYFLLQTQTHIIAIRKNQPPHQHLKYIFKSKDQHIPTKQSTYFNIPSSDYFIFQWSKLYVVYSVEDHSIEKRLFLEKTSNNYTQHWIRAEGTNITLLSFPNRNQIMLQVYNCERSKVEFISKIPVDGWITKYEFRIKEERLLVDIETAEDFVSYVFNRDLVFESESKDKKLSISQEEVEFKSVYFTTTPTDYYKLVENLIVSSFTYLKKRLYGDKTSVASPKSYRYSFLKFYKNNRLYSSSLSSDNIQTLSLGKYLIPTTTPVFHNIQNNTLQQQPDKQPNQPVHYIQNNIIRSENYMTIHQVYPKYQAEWVGLTKGFIHFYPNKQKPGVRFARSANGVMVFDGMKFKGIWKQPIRSQYQKVQYLNRKPEEIGDNYVQGHYFYTGLIAILEMDENGLCEALHFYSGFNGKKMYVEKLNGQYPENVFFSVENNDILISCYDPKSKQSIVTKIEVYSEPKSYSFLTIKRQYKVHNRIINIERHINSYYFTIVSSENIILCSSKATQFNNRRPLSSSYKYPSTYQSKLILQQLRTYQNGETLDLKCIRVEEKGEDVEVGEKIKQIYPLSYYIVVNKKQENKQRFMVFDAVNLLENGSREAAHDGKIQKLKGFIAGCVIVIIVLGAKIGSAFVKNKKETKVNEEDKVATKDSKDNKQQLNPKQTKQKKKKNE